MNTAPDYPRYRWVMLASLMLLTIAIELQWLAHAAVARPATAYYGNQLAASEWLSIDSLALVYMLAYLIFSLPASWVIARFGLRAGLGIGALLLGLFGAVKGIYGDSLFIVLVTQTGLAVAQPFILNAVTTLTDQWFPVIERAMAAGLAVLAQFIGILLAMVITPMLVVSNPADGSYGEGITTALIIYGTASVVIALLSLVLTRPAPESQKTSHTDTSSSWQDIKTLLQNRNMKVGLFLFMVGLGIFNAVSSLTDTISAELHVEDSDGLIATLMLIGGMLGAVILPVISDRLQKRKALLVVCMGGMLPGMAGLAFAGNLSSDLNTVFTIALISSFLLGFFVLGAGPIGFQYIAEVTTPVPEAFSQGMLLLAGQISGIILVLLMSMNNHVSLQMYLQLCVAMVFVCLAAVLSLTESPVMLQEKLQANRSEKDSEKQNII